MKGKTIKIFWMSLLIGYLFELIINALGIWGYDSLDYFLGVPVFIVFAWTFLLTFGYFGIKRFQKIYSGSILKALLITFIPSVIFFETIGSQILKVTLNIDFPSLFPLTGCCKAPVIIYVAYFFVSLYAFRKFDKIR